MNKKGFLEVSFGWLFAIIVGAFILFLAIYGVTKLIKTEGTIQTTKTSKDIGILLNPLETGFESARTSSISFPTDTRIYNKCSIEGNFGNQGIEVEQKSFNKWSKTDITVQFQNKYIFSESYVEGKTFYLFSKPLEFPFKVTDLIYIIPEGKEYCFVDAPAKIQKEILDIQQNNIKVNNCSSQSIKICFDEINCEINVDYENDFVEKNNSRFYFESDALMYAAIFSDKSTYECQVKRVMKRLEKLSNIYAEKSVIMTSRGCDIDLSSQLNNLGSAANNIVDSGELYFVDDLAGKLDRANGGICRLW